MSVKSSARIKKRRSAEAAAASSTSISGSFAAVSSQRLSVTANNNNNNNNNNHNSSNNNNNNSASGVSSSSSSCISNANGNQSISKKHSFVGRNPNFDTDETKLLIQLWGDPKLQRTLITTHKKHAVICQLAAKMQEYGYHRSPEEITTRIKNLKCFYNRLKKDKECGLAGESEPSWKHFAEMDAIMTRPIFSVRPNEVPAPSLKYQLEQALEEDAERRQRRRENGEDVSESENEEDDMLLSSLVPNASNGKAKQTVSAESDAEVQLELDNSEENFVTQSVDKRAASKRRKLSSEADVDIDDPAVADPKVKNEPAQQQDSVTETIVGKPTVLPATSDEDDDDCMLLPLPKEEPIDVDAVDVSEKTCTSMASSIVANARSAMPTLADMLQLPKSTNLLPYSGANVIIPANSISTSVAQLAGTVSTTSTASGKLTAGKISLVPTNFLMQPKQTNNVGTNKSVAVGTSGTQLQILQSAINQGARLMISGGAPTPVQASANTSLVTGPGGVKFVLVNADQAAAAKATATVSKPNVTAISSASLPQQQQQKLLPEYNQQQQQQQHHQQHQNLEKREDKRRAQEKAREEQQSKRHMTTMRIMLRQLLNAQNESNEIQHNRLSLERERLDWEKSMGERLLTLLPTLLQPAASTATVSTVQPATSLQSPQFIVSAGSAGQRMAPPKLLFTTALPMGNGTVSMPHILTPSSALATSLPKVIAAPASSSTPSNNSSTNGASVIASKPVEMCTQINDVQLVTPKLEKEG